MATADKLSYLNTTKTKIRESINLTGAGLTTNDTFRSYAVKLKDTLMEGLTNPDEFIETIVENSPKDEATGTTLSFNAYSLWTDTQLLGDTEQETTTGQQLYNVYDKKEFNQLVTTDSDGWISATYNNTGSSTVYLNFFTNNLNLQTSSTYYVFLEVKSVSGSGAIYETSTNTGSQTSTNVAKTFTNLANNTIYKNSITTISDFSSANAGIRSYIRFGAGESGSVKFRLSVIASATPTTSTFVYEPYTGGIPSPNPNYPQDIEVVTGRQDVDVCGKNLFNSADASVINGYFDGNHTTLTSAGTNRTTYYKCQPNTTYTISRLRSSRGFIGTTQTTPAIGVSISNISSAGYGTYDGTTRVSGTITTGANDKYILLNYANINTETGDIPTQVLNSVQIEKGNISSPIYEPYIGNTYEVNLGKNLLTTALRFEDQTINGVTLKNNEDGSFTINGTATANGQFSTTLSSSDMLTSATKLKPGTYYQQCAERVQLHRADGTWVVNTWRTFTTTEELYVKGMFINITSGTTYNSTFWYQIEKGNQGTSYSPYFTPIELCKIGEYQDRIFKGKGVNLFDTTLQQGAYSFANGSYFSSNNYVSTINKIDVEAGQTYIFSCVGNDYNGIGYIFYNNDTYVSYAMGNRKVTIPSGVNKVYIDIYNPNGVTPSDVTSVQFEKGNTSSLYEPYNAKGKWYLHKEIGEVVLNGTETWQNNYGTSLFGTPITEHKNNATSQAYSNYYTFNGVQSGLDANLQHGQFTIQIQQINQVYIKNTDYTTTTDFKTWLSTHNTEVYYVLASPTYTEITNEELINQLESIKLIDGYNDITVNGDLPTELYIKYLIKE